MIKYIPKGDIFESKAEAYVNPVNLIGVMGAGLALKFKEEFPENFKEYNQLSIKGETAIGLLHFHDVTAEENEDYEDLLVINFPTKSSWKNPSKLEYVEAGLKELVKFLKEEEIESIAIPALGCGLGGLNWEPVKALFEKYLNVEAFEDLDIEIYEPFTKIHK